jgi:hypothetical protein
VFYSHPVRTVTVGGKMTSLHSFVCFTYVNSAFQLMVVTKVLEIVHFLRLKKENNAWGGWIASVFRWNGGKVEPMVIGLLKVLNQRRQWPYTSVRILSTKCYLALCICDFHISYVSTVFFLSEGLISCII